MTDRPCRLVILISGNGSNLQSFIDQISTGNLHAQISAVICNRPGAYGLERARAAGVPAQLVDHTCYENRETLDKELINRIDQYQPDLIILAGFMRILTPQFVQYYYGRLLNIIPLCCPSIQALILTSEQSMPVMTRRVQQYIL